MVKDCKYIDSKPGNLFVLLKSDIEICFVNFRSFFAYFYCIMMISSHKPDTLMQVKHSIYKFCQYCLNLAEQRYLVEFMNMIQKDMNVTTIMKNNQHSAQES